jgi:sterol desaturase/sphingolipid hydroxylase (fatty acid hydroxylase superfamily)
MEIESSNLSLEPYLRLGVFFGVLVLMIFAEYFFPRREKQYRAQRWPSNLSLVVLNTLIVRIILPGATVALAIWAQARGIGLLHWLPMPGWLSFILSVVLLDMLIYWQHRFSHSIPMLWKFHRMHHADIMIDVTTGSRFHPVEIIFSMLVKLAAILLLGPSPCAVIIFEILLNGTAMFNHSNINLPLGVDRVIRKLLVTPDMHRVHHSIYPREYNQNFGFSLSVWDRWFNSYTAQPEDGHLQMAIGLPYFREASESRLKNMVTQPFRTPIEKQLT